jgi:hypothetical protein
MERRDTVGGGVHRRSKSPDVVRSARCYGMYRCPMCNAGSKWGNSKDERHTAVTGNVFGVLILR